MSAEGFFTALAMFVVTAAMTGYIVAASFLIVAGGWLAVCGGVMFALAASLLFCMTWWRFS